MDKEEGDMLCLKLASHQSAGHHVPGPGVWSSGSWFWFQEPAFSKELASEPALSEEPGFSRELSCPRRVTSRLSQRC